MTDHDFDTANQPVNDALKRVEESVRSIMKSTEFVPMYVKKAQEAMNKSMPEPRYASLTGPNAVAWAEMLGGIGLACLTFIMMLVTSVAGAVLGTGASMPVVFTFLMFAASAALFAVGFRARRRIKRFRSYKVKIGKQGFCTIADLASGTGKSNKAVVRDVQDMINRGWFIHGHMDSRETNLIVTEEAWKLCKDAEMQQKVREEEEQKQLVRQAEKKMKNIPQHLPKEVREVIAEGNSYIDKIRECNDRIPDAGLTGKLDRMEEITRRIFECLEKKPEAVGDLKKMIRYYLPTTVKLLETYIEIDAQAVQGENIVQAKQEIAGTLDTINGAYEKLLDSLYQTTAWDVSADISVMKTMMAQQGLVEESMDPKLNKVASDYHMKKKPTTVLEQESPQEKQKEEPQGITLQI